MDEKTINVSMELIGISGQAKGEALRALKFAQDANFNKADEMCAKAKATINSAHKIHSEIIQGEAQGHHWDIQTLFIHAQDHFTASLVICDLIEHIINLYKKTA